MHSTAVFCSFPAVQLAHLRQSIYFSFTHFMSSPSFRRFCWSEFGAAEIASQQRGKLLSTSRSEVLFCCLVWSCCIKAFRQCRAVLTFARCRLLLRWVKSQWTHNVTSIFCCSSALEFSFRFFHFTHGHRKLTRRLRRRRQCCMREY